MKDWEYYSNPKSPFFGHDEKRKYLDKRTKEINEEPLTAHERDMRLSLLKAEVSECITKLNKPHQHEQAMLTEEFWADAREDIGYDKWLTPNGVELLEAKAWADGHSHGFSEVFYHLSELSEFLESVMKHVQTKGKP